ncbi:hypothetical protein BYT27DRAFT_7333988 [Phlegmacium glaucopus]|nr:hypothetical protein BYT27DRAFT_7333988 [Phlegmacium glaucopus]
MHQSIPAFASLTHPLMDTKCGFLTVTWLDYKTNGTTVYYVQVLAPIASLTWVPHDNYLDGEACNIALDKAADCVNLAVVIAGVVFLTMIATLILRRWKKQSTHPSPYYPVSLPEVQMCYVDHITPTSITPEKTSDVTIREPSSQEGELMGSVRRSSINEVKRNPSRSIKRRPVATRPILLVKETEDRSTEEEDYAPQPPKASRKTKCKSQIRLDRVPHDADNTIAHIQGHGSASNSPNGLGLPMYMTNPGLVPHCNPCYPINLHPYPPPMAPYGYNAGGPVAIVNSGVGNITLVTMSDIGNNSSVNNGYRAPRTHTQRIPDKNESEDCEVCLR